MPGLIQSIKQSIRHHQLLKPGDKILVAISGGVDSMVLLHVLNELSALNRWRLCVAHLNHGLRGRSSDADQKLVEGAAKRLRLKCLTGRRNVRALMKKHRLSLEMAARKCRHEFLAASARQFGARIIAVAHHSDDQLELFFLRLLRGSGPEGLGGMKWRSKSPVAASIYLVRPLLGTSKLVLRDYAKEKGIVYREDASNASLDILRNRIRHELLPLLKRRYQPALEATMGRAIELLRDESDLVQKLAQDAGLRNQPGSRKAANQPSVGRRAQPLLFHDSPDCFDRMHVALQRRVLHRQLLDLGFSPDFDLVEQLRLNPLQAVCVRGEEVPVRVARDASGIVQLAPQVPAQAHTFCPEATEVLLGEPKGAICLNDVTLHWRLRQHTQGKILRKTRNTELFDAEKIGPRIILRHWRPGDRFQPIGMGSAVKIQDFFTNEKVPRDKRHQLLLATTASGDVFWIEGMRISDRFKLTKRTIRRLQWSWERF